MLKPHTVLEVASPGTFNKEISIWNVTLKWNKNGVLWSQARMRIEMRLRCYLVIWSFGHLVIGHWLFTIGNWQWAKGNKQ